MGRGILERGVLNMRVSKILIGVLMVLSFAISAHAADTKIGVVDFQKILLGSSAGKAARAEIDKKAQEMEKDVGAKEEEIEELKKTLEQKALVMNRDQREEKQREIRIKINDIKSLQKKYMEDFKMFEARLIKRIQKDVLELLEKMGDRDKYHLIIEKSVVLYCPDAVDITDKVIEEYNKSYSK